MTTSRPAIQLVRHPLAVRRLAVRRVEALSPRMVRVTLGGADLDGFVSLAADDHVKLFFPPDGHKRRRQGDGYAKVRGYWKRGGTDHQEPHED